MLSSGILLLRKPSGKTSFDCIRSLKRKFARTDIGHGGTLDLFAEGVLPVFLGEALKLSRFFLENYPTLSTYWKTYIATLKLGDQKDSGDSEGFICNEKEVPEGLTQELILAKLKEFSSQPYLQTPPKFSAKKINGVRASDLTREGIEVELKPVLTYLKSVEVLDFDSSKNTVRFKVTCSKGTYIRVLAEDLSLKLGTVGHLITLERTEVGCFTLDQCTDFFEILKASEPSAEDFSGFLPLYKAVDFLPQVKLQKNQIEELEIGKTSNVLSWLSNSNLDPNVYCLMNESKPKSLVYLDSAKKSHFLRSFI